jgi:hypothetical protein
LPFVFYPRADPLMARLEKSLQRLNGGRVPEQSKKVLGKIIVASIFFGKTFAECHNCTHLEVKLR